ncbi:MAG TPA: NUDIX hydrolase [Ktedonobacteraceae bacterium]|nr:NUDIX hydrolase [Ktedonobacteraceae bacterium]
MGTGTPATPTVTVDIVLFKKHGIVLQLLLIQRKKPPYQGCWALPGGKLDTGESVEQAAVRELSEETGITGVELQQFHVFSEPERDPRGHYISVAFYGFVEAAIEAHAGDDASAAAWFNLPLPSLPQLAFDHEHIIREALSESILEMKFVRQGKDEPGAGRKEQQTVKKCERCGAVAHTTTVTMKQGTQPTQLCADCVKIVCRPGTNWTIKR